MQQNGFWERMTQDALDELAAGDEGWRNAETNTLVLAAFGLLMKYLSRTVTRPLWWIAASAGAAVVAYIVTIVADRIA